jgi:two-component system nitrate/nitrite sensor histidine kinase NarX
MPSQYASTSAILAQITAGLATGRDLHDLLQRFLQPVVALAGATGGLVRVLSDTGERLDLVSEIGLPSEMCKAEHSVDRHCGFCGAAADNSRVVWASDLSSCTSLRGRAGGQRMLAVPLQHRGRVLGVYNLFFANQQAPSAEVLELLRSVGELLGLALDNARLEEENLRATLIGERQMMAADVHDSLAQSLTFIKMRIPLLRDALLEKDSERALSYCDDVGDAASQAHTSLRSIITQLRTPMDPQGLVHALGASVEAFRRTTATELEFVNEIPDLKLSSEHEAQVFHLVQEALTNIARHAGADHARLCISETASGLVEVLIEDDGAGLPPISDVGSSHYGLEIMRERAGRIGGELEFGQRAGGGTCVRLIFPLPKTRSVQMEGLC